MVKLPIARRRPIGICHISNAVTAISLKQAAGY
jgi:hypothetical protein